MLSLYRITCGRHSLRILATGGCAAISHAMLIFGAVSPISARKTGAA